MTEIENKAWQLINYAMSKQTARPPIKDIEGEYRCPICESTWITIDWDSGEHSKTPYCPSCGQKIDWEKVNNENTDKG